MPGMSLCLDARYVTEPKCQVCAAYATYVLPLCCRVCDLCPATLLPCMRPMTCHSAAAYATYVLPLCCRVCDLCPATLLPRMRPMSCHSAAAYSTYQLFAPYLTYASRYANRRIPSYEVCAAYGHGAGILA
jgi:hypothetical protein